MQTARLFRGCLYGGLIGDVFGAPYECQKQVELSSVLRFIERIMKCGSEVKLPYTDDTVMTLGICKSLKRCCGFKENDLAYTFSIDFVAASLQRGYGRSIRDLLMRIHGVEGKNAMALAAEQFNGIGSLGNGGGMRVAPAALFGFTLPDFNRLILQVTAVTHSHPCALYGALLQANAIRRIFNKAVSSSERLIDVAELISQLRVDLQTAHVEEFAAGGPEARGRISEALGLFMKKLDVVEEFSTCLFLPKSFEVIDKLGVSGYALHSIPTALYIFLRALKGIDGIPFQSLPLTCVAYAVSLGNDTDTVACMAGSLAGVFVGADLVTDSHSLGGPDFPTNIMISCEGLQAVNECVDWLVGVSI